MNKNKKIIIAILIVLIIVIGIVVAYKVIENSVTNREEYWFYYSNIQQGTSQNIQEFFKRVYSFLDELKSKDYKKVLIVAHSGVSKAFSGYFEGIKDGKFLNRGLKNCEMKEYELKQKIWSKNKKLQMENNN